MNYDPAKYVGKKVVITYHMLKGKKGIIFKIDKLNLGDYKDYIEAGFTHVIRDKEENLLYIGLTRPDYPWKPIKNNVG